MNSIYIAVYDISGRFVVDLVTIDEWLYEVPQTAITTPCGPLSLI